MIALLLLLATARAEVPPPPVLQRIGVEEQVGQPVPLDATFIDHQGRQRTLGGALAGRPAVLVLAWFECPMLCDLVLRGVARAARQVEPFHAVTVSFDPRESPAQAAAARDTALDLVGRPEEWPFLVGPPESIAALTASLGFSYETVNGGELAHPAVVFVIGADGRISRYLYGTEPSAEDLSAALSAAAAGRSGPSFGRFLLSCFRYTPAARGKAGRLDLYLRLGGAISVIGLGLSLLLLVRRRRA